MGRGLLEVVGINVGNIGPCNRQCRHSLVPCIKISFVGQAQGDLDTLWLATRTHGEDAFVWKTPLIRPCRRFGIRSTKLWTGTENQSTRIEAVRSWIGLLRCWRFEECDCHARLGIASGTCQGSVHHTIVEIPDGGPALFSLIPESPAGPSAPGRFQRPSERVPFSDEGGFVFSKTPFKGTVHEGLKGASPSEGFKGAWRDLKGAWRGLERGFKGVWRGLERGLKGAEGASRGLEAFNAEGCFKSPPLRWP